MDTCHQQRHVFLDRKGGMAKNNKFSALHEQGRKTYLLYSAES